MKKGDNWKLPDAKIINMEQKPEETEVKVTKLYKLDFHLIKVRLYKL